MFDMASKLRQRMITPEQALAIHDAAHELQDAVLHGLALDFMPMVGAEHIALDSLDEASSASAWGDCGLPLVVPVEEGVICEVCGDNGSTHLLCVNDAGNSTGTEEGFIPLSDRFDSDARYQVHNGQLAGQYAPAYDLCLVRRAERALADAGGMIPGTPLSIGAIKEHGVMKFPAIAHRLEGEPVQIHKFADGFAVYGFSGEVVEMDAAFEIPDVSKLPNGIWLGALNRDHGGLTTFDALVRGYAQAQHSPLKERVKLIEGTRADQRHVPNAEALKTLPLGRWLVRWQEDAPDLANPFWFAYDSGTVRPGQYVETPSPIEGQTEDGGEIVQHRLLNGVRAQVHRLGEKVWVFVDGCAIDRADQLGQVWEQMKGMDADSVVMDGELVSSLPAKKLRSLLMGRKDLSDDEIVFSPFDCLLLDEEALWELPLSERLAKLSDLGYDLPTGTGELLRRPANGTYAIDGSDSGWRIGEIEEAEDPGVADRRLSWAWVDGVHQGDEPMRFLYERRYDGTLSPDEATAAVNFVMQNRAVDGISALSLPLDELRARYRAADWRDAQRIVTDALSTPTAGTDVANIVASVAASGELHVVADEKSGKTLSLAQAVVGHGIQFLAAADHIEDLGTDAMLTADGKWAASQLDSEWVEQRDIPMPGMVAFEDGSAFQVVESGRAVLGVQKPHFHELFLVFDGNHALSGRYVWTLVDLDGDSKWIAQKPEDQTPYLFKHDQAEEVAAALESGGWVTWNPEGIRAIAAGLMPGILPVNWESRLEAYDDAPYVGPDELTV